jgi:outer membrane protein assembly factor BamB
VFYIVDESPTWTGGDGFPYKWAVICRDAFNGKLLWRRPMGAWGPEEWNYGGFYSAQVMNPGVTGEAQARFAVDGDRFYCVLDYHGPLVALDAATGEVIKTYPDTESCSSIRVHNGRLYLACSVNPNIRVLDAESGTELWSLRNSSPYGYALYSNQFCVMSWGNAGVRSYDATTYDFQWAGSNQVKSGDGHGFMHAGDVIVRMMTGAWMALDASNGEVAWTRDVPPESAEITLGRSTRRNQIFATDDKVYTYASSFDLVGLDPLSGSEDVRINATNTCWASHHHRCFSDRATERYFILGQHGVEFISLKGETNRVHNWTRATCNVGITPANGMLYVPPHSCACEVAAMLRGFFAYRPETPDMGREYTPSDRLVTGPAYGTVSGAAAAEDEWPLYRCNPGRTGNSGARVPRDLEPLWSTEISGELTPPVIANGRVFVSCLTDHSVRALSAEDGTPLWTYYAGGVVDGPPTVYGDAVIFGSGDGRAYCLRASDGELVWRFQVAPRDCRNTQLEHVSSAWPVRGSVLVEDGIAYVAAGFSSRLDGGIWVSALDALSGALLHSNRVEHCSPDVPHSDNLTGDRDGLQLDIFVRDGSEVFMRNYGFTESLAATDHGMSGGTGGMSENGGVAGMRHMFASCGFLDDSWNHRMIWTYGGIHGQMLVVDDDNVYGVKAHNQSNFQQSYSPGRGYLLFAQDRLTPGGAILGEPGIDNLLWPHPSANHLWWSRIPVCVRGMARAGSHLFIAGPPDTVVPGDPFAAFEGRAGGTVWTIDPQTGRRLAQCSLTSPPVYDGLAAAGHCLFVATVDGRVVCLGQDTPAPHAIASVSPAVGTVTDTFTFDGSGSYDVDGELVHYEWHIDGALASTDTTFTTTFPTAGVHRVTLAVTDDAGLEGFARAALAVKSAATPPGDSDGDGLLDSWELAMVGSLAMGAHDDLDGDGLDALAELARGTHPLQRDTDGDGLTDAAEVAAGTSPTSAASFVHLKFVTGQRRDRAIAWPSTAGRRYTLWASSNLVQGYDMCVASGLDAVPPLNVYTDSVARAGACFYRVQVLTGSAAPPPNEAPSAKHDRVFAVQDTPRPIDVLDNDSDPDFDVLRVSSVTPPGNGAAAFTPSNVVYTPGAAFLGTDVFTYTVIDGLGGSNSATVTVSVQASSNLVQNGEMEWSLSSEAGNYTQSIADKGWYGGQRPAWSWHPFERRYYVPDDGGDGLLAQVVKDDGVTTGSKPVSFRVHSTSLSDTLRVRVFGIDGNFRDVFRSADPPAGAVELYDSGNAAGSPSEWNDVTGTVNFGSGYQYIIVHIWADDVNKDAGDELYLDDVFVGK